MFVQELEVPSIKHEAYTSTSTSTPNVQVLVVNSAWMQVFIDYIRDHKLPNDKVEAEQIMRRSKHYVLETGSTDEAHHPVFSSNALHLKKGGRSWKKSTLGVVATTQPPGL